MKALQMWTAREADLRSSFSISEDSALSPRRGVNSCAEHPKPDIREATHDLRPAAAVGPSLEMSGHSPGRKGKQCIRYENDPD